MEVPLIKLKSHTNKIKSMATTMAPNQIFHHYKIPLIKYNDRFLEQENFLLIS